jgi:hypothetical protein
MVQGRIDIVRAELNRREGGRTAGAQPGRRASPGILADEPRAPARGLGRHTTVEPSRADSHRRYVEALVADVDLSDVSIRSSDELAHSMRTLSEEEQKLSTKRRAVQVVMDACSAEITRRYRDGEADVATLLGDQPHGSLSLSRPACPSSPRSPARATARAATPARSSSSGPTAARCSSSATSSARSSRARPTSRCRRSALLRAGWEPADEEQVALATASHSGEPAHLDVVRRMLAAAGLSEADLGTRPSCPCPSRPPTPCSAPAAGAARSP